MLTRQYMAFPHLGNVQLENILKCSGIINILDSIDDVLHKTMGF